MNSVAVEILAPEPRIIRIVGKSAITLGRDPESCVVLGDPAVSRRHAVVEVEPDGLWLRNLSVNGTWVNRQLVQGRVQLTSASHVEVAHFRLKFAPGEVSSAEGRHNPVRRKIHRLLLERMDLSRLGEIPSEQLRPQVLSVLRDIVDQLMPPLPSEIDVSELCKELCDEAIGFGPLEDLLADKSVSEIMVVNPHTIFIERNGKLERSDKEFTSRESLRAVIERIVTPLGRRIDESQPLVDARLPDGSRVNAVIPPLAPHGPTLTIRKFGTQKLTLNDLVQRGSMDERIARLLARSVLARCNIVISGGTGSGKTTLLNVLSATIPNDERIVTVEDAAELRLQQPHVVSLETRPANLEGRGEFTIRDLVRNTLRMRPDRIIVGECRGGEALDMLQAMNTGHDGSLTTVHANSPDDAVSRIETLCLMAGVELPVRAIREQIAGAVDVIVQIARLSDGSRKITHVSEVVGVGDDGRVVVEELFQFARTGVDEEGRVEGHFRSTGTLPSFLGDCR